MRLATPVAAKIREGFVRYAAGDLDRNSSLYQVVHVALCYYGGNTDLAQAMLLRDIERNYEKLGVYRSSFSYRRYDCCKLAEEKGGLCKLLARMIASLASSDHVELSFA